MESLAIEKLKTALQGDLRKYKSIPFWSWNNYLDEKVLTKQIEDMKEAGIGGFIMHARTGLMDEYLGEKWFSCIEACLKKARELDMEAWVYDENGWPSGFVGGKLLEIEAYRARFLEYEIGKYDDNAFVTFIDDETTGYKRVLAPIDGVEKYHNVYLRVSPANTDILNSEVVDDFIRETHEKYYERFSESFGRELVGFFTDEPQYYRQKTPYTHVAEKEFEKIGADIKDGLIWLFVHDSRGYGFRTRYYATLSRLYIDNFYKKVYDWCEAHNCKLTGHSIEESSLTGQMIGGGAVMPTYEYEHIPGIDMLGRFPAEEASPKQIGSVCAQLGKQVILTETYACGGFDVTPEELKSIGESQYFHGVNKTCQHLYPYSIAGQGKVDHPPVFGRHSNWFEEFKSFNDYFTRLGYIIGETDEEVDIALLHPIRYMWFEYIRGDGAECIQKIEKDFFDIIKLLRKHGVTYHFVDESILERHGSIEGGELRVGNRKYSTLLIPKMQGIMRSTYGLLKQFKGKLCVLDALSYLDGELAQVDLPVNTSIEEILSSAKVKFFCEDGNSFVTSRKGDLGEFLFIKNLSMTESSEITLQGVAEEYVALDLDGLQAAPISNKLLLPKSSSLILMKEESASPTEYSVQDQDVTANFSVENITENYLVLDCGQLKKAGGEFGEDFPLTGLFDRLLYEDYKGDVTVRQRFVLKEKLPLTLIMEKMDFHTVTVNGKVVSFKQNAFDVNFIEACIDDLVVAGENELVYSLHFWQHEGVHFALFDPLATESLRNCLYYDTSIERAYLKGDFIVDKDRAIAKRTALPAVTSKLYENGYPFFKGKLSLKGKLAWKQEGGARAVLVLDGRFMVANVKVNGLTTDMVFTTKKDITDLLREGENDVEILLKSSLRNLFGPYHYKPTPEPLGVGPMTFDYRTLWINGQVPKDFTFDYNSVPFGVENIILQTKKKI